MQRVLLALLISISLAAGAASQSKSVRIDFGDVNRHSAGTPGQAWNDVDDNTLGAQLGLVDTSGLASGFDFQFVPGLELLSSNTAGTPAADAGSQLDSLGWPGSALVDTMYGSNSNSLSSFQLSGLDPASNYDLTLVASRLGVGDVRTTLYQAQGAGLVSGILDASNNASEYVRLVGLRSDAVGVIEVSLGAHYSNSNANQYYYLNALGLDEYAPGTQAPLLALDTNFLQVSRNTGKPAYGASLGLYTNDGSQPQASLQVQDDATGSPPSWLTAPAMGVPGNLALQFDPSALGLGSYSATLSVSAAGYASAQATLVLEVRAAGILNLLFYGNSYSMFNGGVPSLVAAMAKDAGELEPNDVARLVGGQNLAFHLNDPGQAAAIQGALPPGQEWDFVVLQGFSTEATQALGDPASFRANAVSIVGNVRAHSPSAQAVLYQTWARARGHSYYLGANPSFPSPYDMHREVEDNYSLAVHDINNAFGAGVARRAAAGETVALRNFAPELYISDLSHPLPPITVMAAAAIFQALYGIDPCTLDADFSGASDFAQRLTGFGIDALVWRALSGFSARVADPAARHLPGSGEDLLLQSGVDGPLQACPQKDIQQGSSLDVRLQTPAGSYSNDFAILFVDFAASGALPGPWILHPEIQVNPLRALQLLTAPNLSQPLRFNFVVNSSLPGTSVLFQGVAFGASPKTGNPVFTATDAHEIRFP